MPTPKNPNESSPADLQLIWGASNIGRELGLNTRKAMYLLEAGRLPAKKVGRLWCTSRHGLRQYFADLMPEEAE